MINKNTIREEFITTKGNDVKEEPIQWNQKPYCGRKPRKRNNRQKCSYLKVPNWNPNHKCPGIETTCRIGRKKRQFGKICRSEARKNTTINQSGIGKRSIPGKNESQHSLNSTRMINRVGENRKNFSIKIEMDCNNTWISFDPKFLQVEVCLRNGYNDGVPEEFNTAFWLTTTLKLPLHFLLWNDMGKIF